MSDEAKRIIELNLAQLLAVHATQPVKYLEWGRGAGKSTDFGFEIQECATTLPRSKGFISGSSFRQMLGETLPSTKAGLEKLGWYENIHYYVGRQGPKHWEVPYEAPAGKEWANFIHFYTGAALSLVSQDKSSIERRGQNFDWGLSDEHAQQDPIRFFNECIAGLRTWRRQFIGRKKYLSQTYASTTPVTRSGLHFLKGEELARMEPEKHVFISASARVNAHNLAPDYFETARKAAPSLMIYNAEIENIRPSLVVNGYYPTLKPDRHYYGALDGDYYLGRHVDGKPFTEDCRGDQDLDPNRPLVLTLDPGAAINALVVMQALRDKRELRTLRSFWRLSPSIVQDMVEHDFVPYYGAHRCKEIDLFFDRTAANKQPNTRTTVVEDVTAILRRHGWIVRIRTTGRVINQDEKFHVIGKVLEEKDQRMWKVRINKDNNRDLIIALEHAEAMEDSRGNVKKDKRSEQRDGTPRQHATDLTDAWDLPVFYYAKVAMRGEEVPGDFRLV